MKLDELTRKRIEELCNELINESLYNPNRDTALFAGGMYIGILRLLEMLNIEINNVNKFSFLSDGE
jgi:hypothetical protein